jgi:hypothetical protein
MKPDDLSTPPKPRKYVPRLPEEARSLEPGKFVDVPDADAAKCVRSHGRTKGWKMVQRSGEGIIRVWRLK